MKSMRKGGPADDNREAIRSFVEAGGKELIVIGQEALGYLAGFQDSIFQPGDYEYDILGVKQSFNDVNYDTSSHTGQYQTVAS